MAWQVFGARFETADFTGDPVHFQCFTPAKTLALKAIQSWFVLYNNPTFAGLKMKIYSVKNSIPYQLLWTSDENIADADVLLTYDNGIKALYFGFSTPPYLRGGDTYAIVPAFTSYTGTESAHIAWKKTLGDKVYTHFESLIYKNHVGRNAYDLSLVVSQL